MRRNICVKPWLHKSAVGMDDEYSLGQRVQAVDEIGRWELGRIEGINKNEDTISLDVC